MTGLGIRPNGEIFVCGIRNDQVAVWELLTDRIVYTVPEYAPCVMTDDARVLIYATAKHELVVWDLATHQLLCTLSKHKAPIAALAISADREYITSFSNDGILKIWAVP